MKIGIHNHKNSNSNSFWKPNARKRDSNKRMRRKRGTEMNGPKSKIILQSALASVWFSWIYFIMLPFNHNHLNTNCVCNKTKQTTRTSPTYWFITYFCCGYECGGCFWRHGQTYMHMPLSISGLWNMCIFLIPPLHFLSLSLVCLTNGHIFSAEQPSENEHLFLQRRSFPALIIHMNEHTVYWKMNDHIVCLSASNFVTCSIRFEC